MILNRSDLLAKYFWALIAAQVLTGLCLVCKVQLGAPPQSIMFGLFIGLNVPIVLLAVGLTKVDLGRIFSRGFVWAMSLWAANFLRAGVMSAMLSSDGNDLCGLLHILTAQSLALAYPAYRISRE